MLVDKWWQLTLSAAACGHATASVHGKGDFRILEGLALLMAVHGLLPDHCDRVAVVRSAS